MASMMKSWYRSFNVKRKKRIKRFPSRDITVSMDTIGTNVNSSEFTIHLRREAVGKDMAVAVKYIAFIHDNDALIIDSLLQKLTNHT